MRLSISNIAWNVEEDEAVAQLLQQHALDAIDIAPGKYFPDFAAAAPSRIESLRAWWEDRGISIIGMQALLFGTRGLNVFGQRSSRVAMLEHLRHVCRIGAGLGATRLTFGSPRNRDRSGLADAAAREIASSFFGELGRIAQEAGVLICLEPNPPEYGANFMTTAAETAQVVRMIDHPAIRMQFDTGALTMTREDAAGILASDGFLVGHIHASEPGLVPLGDGSADHPTMAGLLSEALPSHIVTIEMVATEDEPHLVSIKRAIGIALDTYGDRTGDLK